MSLQNDLIIECGLVVGPCDAGSKHSGGNQFVNMHVDNNQSPIKDEQKEVIGGVIHMTILLIKFAFRKNTIIILAVDCIIIEAGGQGSSWF